MRQEILLRKLLSHSPEVALIFDSTIVLESGVSARLTSLSKSIQGLIIEKNEGWQKLYQEDLFKMTTKSTQSLLRLHRAINDYAMYKEWIDDLFFLFRESIGNRLGDTWPVSFADINLLRTDLRHDIDHGECY